jgi:hypothetical protein
MKLFRAAMCNLESVPLKLATGFVILSSFALFHHTAVSRDYAVSTVLETKLCPGT